MDHHAQKTHTIRSSRASRAAVPLGSNIAQCHRKLCPLPDALKYRHMHQTIKGWDGEARNLAAAVVAYASKHRQRRAGVAFLPAHQYSPIESNRRKRKGNAALRQGHHSVNTPLERHSVNKDSDRILLDGLACAAREGNVRSIGSSAMDDACSRKVTRFVSRHIRWRGTGVHRWCVDR